MILNSNQAWRHASRLVTANRDVLVALAGVFFLLPSVAFSLFLPQPQPIPGMDRDAALAMVRDHYLAALPFLIPVLLMQAAGTLAIVTLFSTRVRHTVGEALRMALLSIGPYLAAQLMLGVFIGAFGAALGVIAALSHSSAVLWGLIGVFVVALVYLWVKTSLLAPVMAIDQLRNPWLALTRSWRLTDGNGVRLTSFYLLLAVVCAIIITAGMTLVGIALALAAPPGVAEAIAAFASALLSTAITVYFLAVLTAVHLQLAGPLPDDGTLTTG